MSMNTAANSVVWCRAYRATSTTVKPLRSGGLELTTSARKYLAFTWAFDPISTAFFWRNWRLEAWTGVRFVGLKTGPKESW